MEMLGLTQPKLAERVGMTQGAINKIANNNPNGSSKLHLIARALLTTPAYLTGEVDDPDEDAPPPVPAPEIRFVTMSVALPPEAALAEMFDALLAGITPQTPVDERAAQARLLAERLPIGLSRLQDLRPAPRRGRRELAATEGQSPDATRPRERQR